MTPLADGAALVEVEGLRYAWPRAAADCLVVDRLRIAAGRSLFIEGPSGCGKSTLLGLLAGVLLPGSGRVAVAGREWRALSGARRDAWRAAHVGYVFQQFNLLPYLSVIDNVLLPCRFSREREARAAPQSASGGSAAGAARALLQRVGLPEAAWLRPAGELSVGQQQRVAAARALIGRPALVIADEPTSALDARLRESFMALLLGECREAGSTLVFVSHDERLAERFDERLSLPTLNRAVAGAAAT
jgi:putative ABC transport system ATP-binding protein